MSKSNSAFGAASVVAERAASNATTDIAAAAANASANAAACAHTAAGGVARANSVVYTTTIASEVAGSGLSIWKALGSDADRLDSGENASHVAFSALWTREESLVVEDQLHSFWLALDGFENNWAVWQSWYDSRLKGQPSFHLPKKAAEEVDLLIARQSEAWWRRTPEAINADIAEWVSEAKKQPNDDQQWVDDYRDGIPMLPPQRPASLQPVWRDGMLSNQTESATSSISVGSMPEALAALRDQLEQLSSSARESGQIDDRFIAFLDSVVDTFPTTEPSISGVFALGHQSEMITAYAPVAAREWPDLLNAQYRATQLMFERLVDRFPSWTEFKRDSTNLNSEQVNSSVIAEEFVADALKDRTIDDDVSPEITKLLDQLAQQVDEENFPTELRENDQARESRARDLLESLNNLLKRIAEAALRLTSTTGRLTGYTAAKWVEGAKEEYDSQSKDLGKWFVKWSFRTLKAGAVTAVVGVAGLPFWQWLTITFPTQFGWLGPAANALSKFLGVV